MLYFHPKLLISLAMMALIGLTLFGCTHTTPQHQLENDPQYVLKNDSVAQWKQWEQEQQLKKLKYESKPH